MAQSKEKEYASHLGFREGKGINHKWKLQPHRQENHMDKGVESGCGGSHRQLMVLPEIEEGDGKCGAIRQRGCVCVCLGKAQGFLLVGRDLGDLHFR